MHNRARISLAVCLLLSLLENRRTAGSDESAEIPPGISAFVQSLVKAVRDKDPVAAGSLIDVPRLSREIEQQKILRELTSQERTSFEVALKTLVGEGLNNEGKEAKWRDCFAQGVRFTKDGGAEAVATLRILSDGGATPLVALFLAYQEG